MEFAYIYLDLLHKAHFNNRQDQQSVINVDDGRLVIQSKKLKRTNAILSIVAWTDVYMVYIHSVLAKHKPTTIELFINMSTTGETAKDTSKE